MALQQKTFSWGDYAYGSESNAYVLELVLTENSISQGNNTSEIAYTLQLKSGKQNRFQCDVTSTLKLNGVQVATKTENKYLDYNSTWTLLSGTATVKHGSDGSLNMPIQVSIDTTDSNPYAPPDKTLNWTWQLTKIDLTSACTAPTIFTASPAVFDDEVALAWDGAAGGTENAITGYEIESATSPDGSAWSRWAASKTVTGTSTTDAPDIERGQYIKYRIRTQGSAGSSYYSGWRESDPVQKDNEPYVYIHNASLVPERHLAYIYDGSHFVKYMPYVFDGTSWQRYS